MVSHRSFSVLLILIFCKQSNFFYTIGTARKICNDGFDGNLRCPLALHGVETKAMRKAVAV